MMPPSVLIFEVKKNLQSKISVTGPPGDYYTFQSSNDTIMADIRQEALYQIT